MFKRPGNLFIMNQQQISDICSVNAVTTDCTKFQKWKLLFQVNYGQNTSIT